MTLLICRTCPRYDLRRTGEFAETFRTAITEAVAERDVAGVAVRSVQCLGGCPADGVVALDAPGKARVRFSGVRAADAASLVEAALAYESADDGRPDTWALPEALRPRLSSVTPKRGACPPDAGTRP